MRRPILIGLTGSVGMGKTTTAAMLSEAGIPVWDADAAVHRLYAPGGAAVAPIAALRPDAIRDGAVDRQRLKDWIRDDKGALGRIEAVVHPLVARDRALFIERAAHHGARIVVLDIPLLFETGAASTVDAVVVVTAPPDLQRDRVLARPGMTGADLKAILDRQMPDAEKRRRADFIVETDTMDHARRQVTEILREVARRHA